MPKISYKKKTIDLITNHTLIELLNIEFSNKKTSKN